MTKTSKAQIEAVKRYQQRHIQQTRYTRSKSAAKNFILKSATLDDLKWLKQLIKEKLGDDRK